MDRFVLPLSRGFEYSASCWKYRVRERSSPESEVHIGGLLLARELELWVLLFEACSVRVGMWLIDQPDDKARRRSHNYKPDIQDIEDNPGRLPIFVRGKVLTFHVNSGLPSAASLLRFAVSRTPSAVCDPHPALCGDISGAVLTAISMRGVVAVA
ncbi:hypothetical protein CONLIGDRAFT_468523 [Coniochaeta ligniaria NRRL 30616]|uniref:Uncharacterized protein n=1 Tax=Coniochaeta ligniaria NRRL 30616 TaxID=1408157 RepID=A0A1J7IFP8_9PEZI|nr:hypothetical protein CONLIGDRAFT_468523 [Coniochaeta ligniaria NRRL 30616]